MYKCCLIVLVLSFCSAFATAAHLPEKTNFLEKDSSSLEVDKYFITTSSSRRVDVAHGIYPRIYPVEEQVNEFSLQSASDPSRAFDLYTIGFVDVNGVSQVEQVGYLYKDPKDVNQEVYLRYVTFSPEDFNRVAESAIQGKSAHLYPCMKKLKDVRYPFSFTANSVVSSEGLCGSILVSLAVKMLNDKRRVVIPKYCSKCDDKVMHELEFERKGDHIHHTAKASTIRLSS